MAVAEPCCKKEWGEWKIEMEKRRRRWTEKVSSWANLEVSDNEEEEEVAEWGEGEDDSDVFEPQVMEEQGGSELATEENERASDGKVEEGLIKVDDEGDDEEEQLLEQRGECDRMEQEQQIPKDQMEEEERGAEPETGEAEPQVMEEGEQTEVRERVGAAAKMMVDVKVHTDEAQREVEQTGKNNLLELDNVKRSEKDEDEGADNDKEEDWYQERMNDEDRADIPNELNNVNSLCEDHHTFTEETELVAQPPTDDLKDPEEEEESDEADEEEASVEDIADEDVVKIYCVDGYPSEMFSALRDFRDASLLTDLTLSTAEGSRWCVHAAVLAAISSHVCQRLKERTAENSGIHIHLGPEVDAVGVAAVVEFAYGGFISALDADTVHRVEAAAGALGACRVMELCRQSV